MSFALVGTGGVAISLAKALVALKKQVVFATRDPKSDKTVATLKEVPGTVGLTHVDACAQAKFVVLCTPGGQPTLDVFTTLYKAGVLTDKIVIDLTNPFTLDHLKSTSGGEMLQNISGPTVKVVKTLNTIGHNKYGSPTVGGEKADMFVAADNNDAKSEALNLVKEMGFNPVDAGGISASRWMEALCYGWVHMAHAKGLGREIAWKLLVQK